MYISFALLGAFLLVVAVYIFAAIFFVPKMAVRSMPVDIQKRINSLPNHPRWRTRVGYALVLLLLCAIIAILIVAGVWSVRDNLSRVEVFLRYIIILGGYKVFDIVCLDWLLITKTHFFQHIFPVTEGCEGYHQFGFNRKTQARQCIGVMVISLVLAFLLG